MAIAALRKLVGNFWLPSLLTVLGVAAALGVSRDFERERREHLERSAEAIATESRAAIALKFQQHLLAVQDLARIWARFGHMPEVEWVEDAHLLMRNVSGFSYVAWVAPGSGPTRVAPAPEAHDPISLDEKEARTHSAAPAIVGPERGADAGFSYRLYYPVRLDEEAAGVLAARVDVDRLLAPVMRGSAPGYAVEIFWGDQQIFSHGRPSRSEALAWWRAEGEVPVGFGITWRVVHEPTEELAAVLLTPLPRLLLVGGTLLAVALGVIVFQLQQAQQRGRALADTNRTLDIGIREAREGEASLRRLSEELEERVRSRTRQLEDTMTDLEAFNFSVSHDLRSPIGAVLNFVAILEEEHAAQLAPSARALVGRIRGSAERAISLLEGLLKLSRASRTALEIEPLDMTALAREAFAQARDGTDQTVEFVLEPLPSAKGDRSLIGSVFLNLLGNSLKYTRGREKRRITVSGASAEGVNVYSVSDNGVGFDTRHAGKLFRAFERLHPADQFEGAGIGLAIVARVVQRHGGRVWAEGEPEQGATFFFSLARPDGSRS